MAFFNKKYYLKKNFREIFNNNNDMITLLDIGKEQAQALYQRHINDKVIIFHVYLKKYLIYGQLTN